MDFKLDGAEKVRFAQARTAPDEQWVISAGWIRRNGLRGCVGKLVGRADYKAVEGVAVHLRVGRGLGAAGLDVVHQLVPRQHLEVEVAGKQVIERRPYDVAEAVHYDAALEVRAGVQHQLAVR